MHMTTTKVVLVSLVPRLATGWDVGADPHGLPAVGPPRGGSRLCRRRAGLGTGADGD
jgi:hypothetical protein